MIDNNIIISIFQTAYDSPEVKKIRKLCYELAEFCGTTPEKLDKMAEDILDDISRDGLYVVLKRAYWIPTAKIVEKYIEEKMPVSATLYFCEDCYNGEDAWFTAYIDDGCDKGYDINSAADLQWIINNYVKE